MIYPLQWEFEHHAQRLAWSRHIPDIVNEPLVLSCVVFIESLSSVRHFNIEW